MGNTLCYSSSPLHPAAGVLTMRKQVIETLHFGVLGLVKKILCIIGHVSIKNPESKVLPSQKFLNTNMGHNWNTSYYEVMFHAQNDLKFKIILDSE